MSDDTPLLRQWKLLRMLSSRHHGLAVRDMAAEAGVSAKTIRRALDTFRAAGFPVEEVVGDHGRKCWRIAAHRGQAPLTFTYDEALALYLGRRFLEPLAGTCVGEAARCAFAKIRASLGEPALEYLRRTGDLFHQTTVGAGDYAARSELIDALMLAFEDRKVARIAYQSEHATEPATRAVHPYGLADHRGSLYLIAYAPGREQVRYDKVDRISAVEVGTESFERPEDFDIAAHLAGAFGIYRGTGEVAIRVRFLPAAARYVLESNWHPSQRLTRQPDGSLLAEFRLTSTAEIKGWVLSFGARALVLEPEGLRREIAEELRALTLAYDSGNTPRDAIESEGSAIRHPPRRSRSAPS